MTKLNSSRLGTRMRGLVAEAYAGRGHSTADLHLHYSQKMQSDVVLVGQLAYLHFLRVERDPSIASVDYAPGKRLQELVGNAIADLVSAVVVTTSGEVVWRRLIREAPDQADNVDELHGLVGRGVLQNVSRLEVLTISDLSAQENWIRNTHRALAWIAAARDWPLTQYKKSILDVLKDRRTLCFQQCLEMGEGSLRALYGAAALQLALNGSVESNLGDAPLNATTSFVITAKGA